MSAKSLGLEQDVAEMEDRLASVKVRVEAERVAWKKSYRTGKSGTKWKGAAHGQPPSTGAVAAAGLTGSSPSQNGGGGWSGDPEASAIMPSYWDALELAQYLQTAQLTAFAQVVIYEQITGKALLDTPPGKMRQLFQDVVSSSSDPNWKAFQQLAAKLQKQQKKMERASASLSDRSESSGSANASRQDRDSPASPRGAPTLFPQISPRVPGLTSTRLRASTSEIADESESERRRAKVAMPLRKPPASGQQLATCWNCGSRFPRSLGSVRGELKASKVLSTRTFCSKECQRAIESSDISIAPSVSASLQVSSAHDATRESLSDSHSGTPIKLRAFRKAVSKSKPDGADIRLLQAKASAEGLIDLLQVAHKRGPLEEAPRPAPPPPQSSSSTCGVSGGKPAAPGVRKRIKASGGSGSSISSTRGVLPPSIPPLVLTSASEASRHCKVFHQSIYKLDPELYQANGVSFAACFYDGAAAASGTSATRKNLMRLQEYMSVKALYRLSLTSRSWFEAVHQSSLADPLWGFHLLRTWKRSEEDEVFLHEIGALSKPERPRQMMKKLTRRVGRVVLENMKTLLNAENWHLAAPMTSHPTLTLQSALRASRLNTPSSTDAGAAGGLPSPSRPDLALVSADLFEQIALVYNRKGEVVAVRAQELIRPVSEDQTLTDILLGMRTGALLTVECRRLRLFSTANRLPFEQWRVLPHCRSVFDFFWSPSSSSTTSNQVSSSLEQGIATAASAAAASPRTVESPVPRVWHQKIMERMQKAIQHRLLGKESVQQILRSVQERNGPPQALVSLERFLTACHASGMVPQTSKKRRELQLQHHQQHSPTSRAHAQCP